MRLKDDGSLDGLDHWLDPPAKTPEEENEDLLNSILRNLLRNHPNLTREEAQEQIDLFG
jgi:hypothetical protein